MAEFIDKELKDWIDLLHEGVYIWNTMEKEARVTYETTQCLWSFPGEVLLYKYRNPQTFMAVHELNPTTQEKT
mgnify:CR=1 FL=1